jgi:hypothetical protein
MNKLISPALLLNKFKVARVIVASLVEFLLFTYERSIKLNSHRFYFILPSG